MSYFLTDGARGRGKRYRRSQRYFPTPARASAMSLSANYEYLELSLTRIHTGRESHMINLVCPQARGLRCQDLRALGCSFSKNDQSVTEHEFFLRQIDLHNCKAVKLNSRGETSRTRALWYPRRLAWPAQLSKLRGPISRAWRYRVKAFWTDLFVIGDFESG